MAGAKIGYGDLGATAPAYLAEVGEAFMSGFGVASLVVAAVAGAGAVFAAKFLPARAADVETVDVDLGDFEIKLRSEA